ncbi:hypothetical protein PHYPSEUDO_000029 [Phytophthora pseudosyringae]|uniref:Uncharacterized protein n=1 Tax=Phytophthora pseudosyringae TaxID=221518 RepID=A0A8T1WIB7_9STRA|nr:hypothetical protein PHYPSEUDO_000029 [Phytophthora pseudosyringae]
MMAAVDDVGRADLAAPPSTQLLLAAHPDRYRQLLRTFVAWKQRAQTQSMATATTVAPNSRFVAELRASTTSSSATVSTDI